MDEKDKEAFDVWVWDNFNLTYELNPSQYDDLKDSWQVACEYKQKEIDQLKDRLHHEVKMIDGAARDHIEKLQVENAKLRNDIKEILTLSFYDLQGDDVEILNDFKSEYLK